MRRASAAGAASAVLAALAIAGIAGLGAGGAGAAPSGGASPPVPAGRPAFASALLLAPGVLRERPSGGRILARLRMRTEFRSPRILGVVARRGAWLRVLAPELPNGRAGWIRTGRVLEFAVDWRIDASLGARRAVVRHAGRVVRRVPVAVGTPATPTPLGRFAVTDKLRFADSSPYGYGALALSGHQPLIAQGWGGGDRIAIHGTSAPGSIGSAASHGCLRARRADVAWLVRHVPLGTPLFIHR